VGTECLFKSCWCDSCQAVPLSFKQADLGIEARLL